MNMINKKNAAISALIISCVIGKGNLYASNVDMPLQNDELDEVIAISLLVQTQHDELGEAIARSLLVQPPHDELDEVIAISLLDQTPQDEDNDFNLAIEQSLRENDLKEVQEYIAKNLGEQDIFVVDLPVNEVIKPVIEREITDKDYFEFGKISAILFQRSEEEMLTMEAFLYPEKDNQILKNLANYQYGIQHAADMLQISVEEATVFNTRLETRKDELSCYVTNPTDKETYLVEYMRQYDVSKHFAERVYNQIMGSPS